MKVFQKQFILLLVTWVGLSGAAAYFYFTALDHIVGRLTQQSASLIAFTVKAEVEQKLAELGFKDAWSDGFAAPLRQLLFEVRDKYQEVEEFVLVTRDSQVVFSLNSAGGIPSNGSHGQAVIPTMNDNVSQIAIAGVDDDAYVASWNLGVGSDLRVILGIDAQAGIRDMRHQLNLKLYLVAFAGILTAILVSLLGARVLKSPMNQITKAMDQIDKRSYGFRIKAKPEDEFAETYQKVNRALTRLEQLDSVQRAAVQRRNSLANEMKTISRFMDIMAHEIKNPLHALVINVDVLKSKIQKGLAKTDTLKHARIIEREIDHLKEVVGGFLKYLRPGVPQKERLKTNDIAKEVCQMVAAEAGKRKIKIETRLGKDLRDVVVDRGQIQQALHNIVINAIHASSDQSKIQVRTWEKGRKSLIAVRDAGTGMSKEELKKIFDLYYTTKKDGSGIGVPVTRRIIEANSGQIQFESKVGKGTTVTIMFSTV